MSEYCRQQDPASIEWTRATRYSSSGSGEKNVSLRNAVGQAEIDAQGLLAQKLA